MDVEQAGPIVEGVFAEHATILRLPSIAWGVVDAGELIMSCNADAAYRIASMTKSFTCAAVLLLRDEGVLALDDLITRHAPELAHLRGPTRDSPPLTIRHLMTMSAGFATDDAWADRHLDVTDEELDTWLAGGITFAAAPATMFEYSNLGFGVLGRIVLRATGRPLQDLVTERLLRPLGMRHTTWTAPPGAVSGYRRVGDRLEPEPPLDDGAIAPMGGLFTTVADLARWVVFLAEAFPPRDDPDEAVLCRATRREMQQVQCAFPPRAVTTRDGRQRTISGGYGFGLNVLHGERVGWSVSHSGGLPGFGSNMRWVPDAGIGLIALANLTYAPMAEATAAVLDALTGRGLAVAARPAATDVLHRAATLLVALHNEWDDAVADTLFSDNVFLDADRDQRRMAAGRIREERGLLRLARVEVESASSAVAVAHADAAEVRIDFQLHPLVPPLVQHYDTEIVS